MRASEAGDLVPRRARGVLVVALLALAASLAVSALLGDSATFDEVIHLPAGIVHLRTGDLRLAPDHPPLARAFAALPSLAFDVKLPDPASNAFRTGDFVRVGRELLLEKNPTGPLLTSGRLMIVLLLLALLVLVHRVARRLFGPDAALLALAAAALSPALLAHGHLVTTDLAAALLFLAVLASFASVAALLSPGRVALAALALAALVLTKFSWPLVLPALAAMGLAVVLRKEPWPAAFGAPGRPPIARRGARAQAMLGVGAASIAVVVAALWAGYGFRYAPFRGETDGKARMYVPAVPGEAAPADDARAWASVLRRGAGGSVASGPVAGFVRWARDRRALPEAWLYGVALLQRMSTGRTAYLRGEIGPGWRAYFPVAFAVKTPLPALVLAALGLAALTRLRPRDSVLAAGLAVFGVSYAAVSVLATMNVGHRHLLPLEPLLALLAGASVAWAATRAGRAVLLALVVWLGAEVALTHPYELGYFNEIAGGWRNGWTWLADSNVDWGQDLGRLARWARAQGDPGVSLAYFGAADPSRSGFAVSDLASSYPFAPRASLRPGTYAASVNQLLGLFMPQARDAFWDRPGTRAWYAEQWAAARRGALSDGSPGWDAFAAATRGRLLNGLKRLEPDAYVGTSIRVYRLSEADLESILTP